jgi:hypothetical protein
VLNSVFKINFYLLKYSFFNFSFSFLCVMPWLCSVCKYLHAFLVSVLQCSSQICFLCMCSFKLYPFF